MTLCPSLLLDYIYYKVLVLEFVLSLSTAGCMGAIYYWANSEINHFLSLFIEYKINPISQFSQVRSCDPFKFVTRVPDKTTLPIIAAPPHLHLSPKWPLTLILDRANSDRAIVRKSATPCAIYLGKDHKSFGKIFFLSIFCTCLLSYCHLIFVPLPFFIFIYFQNI